MKNRIPGRTISHKYRSSFNVFQIFLRLVDAGATFNAGSFFVFIIVSPLKRNESIKIRYEMLDNKLFLQNGTARDRGPFRSVCPSYLFWLA